MYGSEDRILPEMASLGAILIALGLFLCVMGFRLFKPMLLIMGLLTFGSMTWIALANCKPLSGYMNDQITMIVVPAGLGILGAALYFHFWYFTIYLVGGKNKLSHQIETKIDKKLLGDLQSLLLFVLGKVIW